MQEEVEFNYFYQMFREENRRILLNSLKDKISSEEVEIEQEFFLMFPNQYSTEKEKLNAYDRSLFHVCTNYISLSNSNIDVFPNNPFEFVVGILDEIEYNPYKYSFLMSLQFIYQEYLHCLEVGSPILGSSGKDSLESYMEITLDSRYQILQFDCINRNLLEQTKTMTEFVIMQKNKQIGPLPKVKYKYRKDI